MTSRPVRSSAALPRVEPVVVLVEHTRHGAAQQPQVGRPRVRRELRHGLFDVDRVARVDDRQPRAGPQDREILGGLMAGPVAGGQPGQRADDVDVQTGLGDVQAEEVVGPARGEHRVGGRERHEPDLGQPRGRAEHGLLGHAHLEEAVGVGVAEDVHVGVLGQVGGQPDDLRALLGQPGEGVAERGAGGALAGVGERGDHRRRGELLRCGGRVVVTRQPFLELVAGDLPFVLGHAHEVRLLPGLQQRHAAADAGVTDRARRASRDARRARRTLRRARACRCRRRGSRASRRRATCR